MTLSMFDPICFGQYPKGEEPLVLHFQYEGSEDIFRYVLVETIPISEINTATRRKQGESSSGEDIRNQYIPPKAKPIVKKPEVVPEVVVPKKVAKKKPKKKE